MPRKTTLEAELRAITEEFVARIVAMLTNASFAEVASLSMPHPEPKGRVVEPPLPKKRAARGTAASRDAELAKQVLSVLANAPGPMNARALASALGVHLDKLAKPLKQLRDEGRIKKHGDKRATTYGVS